MRRGASSTWPRAPGGADRTRHDRRRRGPAVHRRLLRHLRCPLVLDAIGMASVTDEPTACTTGGPGGADPQPVGARDRPAPRGGRRADPAAAALDLATLAPGPGRAGRSDVLDRLPRPESSGGTRAAAPASASPAPGTSAPASPRPARAAAPSPARPPSGPPPARTGRRTAGRVRGKLGFLARELRRRSRLRPRSRSDSPVTPRGGYGIFPAAGRTLLDRERDPPTRRLEPPAPLGTAGSAPAPVWSERRWPWSAGCCCSSSRAPSS